MTESIPPLAPDPLLPEDDLLAFIPVPALRRRSDGWTPVQQSRFIQALSVMGSVAQAAKAVGLSRKSTYALRERPGAESFAACWDRAIDFGRQRQFDHAMERAMNGITTIQVMRGGTVSVNGGPDMAILRSALRSGDDHSCSFA